MPNFLAYLIGVLGALVLCLGATQFSDQIVVEFFGAFLALTAASYFGSALSQKNSWSSSKSQLFLSPFLGPPYSASGSHLSGSVLGISPMAHGIWCTIPIEVEPKYSLPGFHQLA